MLNHLTEVLKDHPHFTWDNYAVEWECDHIIPFKKMHKFNVSDYFKINNWRNLRPRTPEKNKRQNHATEDDNDSINAEAEEESQSLNAPGEQESLSY